MFDKIKELNELRRQAKKMQQLLAEEAIVVEKGGIKIQIRGDQKIDWIEIDGTQDKRLTDAVNEAVKEAQKIAARKMQGQMGDFKLPGF